LEFEVADIKPVDPNARPTGPVQFGVSPGGRVTLPGQVLSLRVLVALAWNLPTNSNTQMIGAPKWTHGQLNIVRPSCAAGHRTITEGVRPDTIAGVRSARPISTTHSFPVN
jgi:hypothetical protein